MKRYEDYKDNKAAGGINFKRVDWTKYKIVVPTEADRIELKNAFKHLHDADNVDTEFVTVNQLIHEYSNDSDDNIVVSEELYKQLNKA